MGSSVKSHQKSMSVAVKDLNNPSGPVKVGKLTVRIDRDLCIGAATCSAVAAKAFGLDGESKSVVLASADEEAPNLLIEAAKACPVAAILIEDENGNRVYPK